MQKKIKTIVAFILIALLCLSVGIFFTACGEQGNKGSKGLKYYPLEDGTYAVGVGTASYLEEIFIPSTYNGKPVSTIADYAFENAKLKSITLPESLTMIGNYAFSSCSRLMSIKIPDSVTSIGYGAFENCNLLKSITLPFIGASKGAKDNSYFGYIFGANSFLSNLDYIPHLLKTVVITGSDSIGKSAFNDCSSLESITIPASVTSIGEFAFYGCLSLKKVSITDIVAWCNISFFNDYSNPLDYAKALYLNDKLVTEVVIPDSVTSIGNYTFSGCSSLTSVTIGNGVTNIGFYAFRDCSSLQSLTIPDNVTSIKNDAFRRYESLNSVTFENPNGWRVFGALTPVNGKNILSTELANSSKAAEYLKSSYCGCYWKLD